MTFDPTIKLGSILIAAGLLISFAAAHVQNVRRLEKIETKLDVVFEWFTKSVIGRSDKED